MDAGSVNVEAIAEADQDRSDVRLNGLERFSLVSGEGTTCLENLARSGGGNRVGTFGHRGSQRHFDSPCAGQALATRRRKRAPEKGRAGLRHYPCRP